MQRKFIKQKRKDSQKAHVNDPHREGQVTRRVTPKCLKSMHGRNFKRKMMTFQYIYLEIELYLSCRKSTINGEGKIHSR